MGRKSVAAGTSSVKRLTYISFWRNDDFAIGVLRCATTMNSTPSATVYRIVSNLPQTSTSRFDTIEITQTHWITNLTLTCTFR